jgi:predicted DCC family thiol-disulfide oxidoreductase YuxK
VQPIVFFDGVCGLCNGIVDILLKIDRRGALRFATLQGETAARELPVQPGSTDEWSVVYMDERGAWRESDAVLAICSRLGFPWSAAGVFRVIPRGLRDRIYRWIGRHRYRWFGRRETCRLPSSEERSRFFP